MFFKAKEITAQLLKLILINSITMAKPWGSVLFKPTLAEKQFRLTFEGHCLTLLEETQTFQKIMVSQLNHGLRLNGKVWELISSEIYVAMGNYYFTVVGQEMS